MCKTHKTEIIMHKNNPIMKIIHEVFAKEIANPYTVTAHAITLKFPDHNQAIIGAILTTAPLLQVPPFSIKKNYQHTFHYLHQHDHNPTNSESLTPFTLHSLADCRSYLDDLCRTCFNAQFNDFELTFPDGSTYLIVITSA